LGVLGAFRSADAGAASILSAGYSDRNLTPLQTLSRGNVDQVEQAAEAYEKR